MTRYARFALVAAVGGAAVVGSPAPAPAQIQMSGGFGASFPGPNRTTPVGPLGVPFSTPSFRYRSGIAVSVGTPFGPTVGFSQFYTGAAGWWLASGNGPEVLAPRYNNYPWRQQNTGPGSFLSGGGNGYMSGGVNPQYYAATQDLARAQKSASDTRQYGDTARGAIANQWDTERGVNAPTAPNVVPNANLPQDLVEAIAAPDDARLISGVYLNRLLVAIAAAEARGGKGAGAQLGPQLLAEVRFGGSPAADALTVIRRATRLDFPAAFDTVDALVPFRAVLEADILAVAGPARLGKPVDPLKAAKFEADVKKAQDALTPALGGMSFEDAVAARRFLNQLDGAARVSRDQRLLQALVVPAWDVAGVGVPDLVRHMAKYKLQFGPADVSAAEAYLTVHHSLVAYLFVLEQSAPPKK